MRTFVVVLLTVAAIGCEPHHEPAAETPAKSEEQPAAMHVTGLEPGWELAPRATCAASQTPGEVIIKANGSSPTAGYEVKLVQSTLRIWPPQYMLAHKKPNGIVAQVVTPFEVTASFNATDPVSTVVVIDAAGRKEVIVDQARD